MFKYYVRRLDRGLEGRPWWVGQCGELEVADSPALHRYINFFSDNEVRAVTRTVLVNSDLIKELEQEITKTQFEALWNLYEDSSQF